MSISEAFNPVYNARRSLGDHAAKNGLHRIAYDHKMSEMPMRLLPGPTSSSSDGSSAFEHRKAGSVFTTVNKLAQGKLSLKAKILQLGRAEKSFRKSFSVREGEQLLKASHCCLFTTAGPISGRLFVSTAKLAFCSDKPIAKVLSPSGESLRYHYKVVIPLAKVSEASQSENEKKPSQKYLQVVTTDGFDFWFMGFLSYKRTYRCLQQAVSQSFL